jgi:TolB-like protein
MSTTAATNPARPPPVVFLSYASEDRQAARSIRDSLQAGAIEVWYDESALDGGDAWDQKIRRQIRECDFFVPVISAQTEARAEGYFRREWRFAVERTLDMADDHPFLLPIVIDDTAQAGARVPEKFLAVQWLRLPGGQPTAALEALCRRLVSGRTAGPPPKRAAELPPAARTPAAARVYPEFPRQEPGQRLRFWLHVLGWALQSAWISFNRLPRWVRILAYVWLAVAALSRGCTPSEDDHARKISSADARRLKQISEHYQGSLNKDDVARLATQIAQEFSDEAGATPTSQRPLLAIPFTAPADDPAARKLADTTFAQVYGRVAISHHGNVSLTDESLSSPEPAAAAALGRARHARYVLFGSVDRSSTAQALTVRLVSVADGSVLWSDSFTVAGADPAGIAAAVDARVPSLEGN